MNGPSVSDHDQQLLGAGLRLAPDDEQLRREFLAAHPVDPFLASLPGIDAPAPELHSPAGRRNPLFSLLRSAVAFACVGLILVLGIRFLEDSKDQVLVEGSENYVGLKGRVVPAALDPSADIELAFAVKRGERVTRGEAGMACSQGDALRLSLSQQAYDWALAFSVDEHGEVSLLYGGEDGRSLQIPRGRGLALPGSRELDDYVGPEWYLVVLSREPIDAGERRVLERRISSEVRAQLRSGASPGELRLDDESLGLRSDDARKAKGVAGFWIEKR